MDINNLTPAEAAFAGGIFAGTFLLAGICAIIFYILLIVAWWKIFEKAGEKGWKAIIPIYNIYIMFKIVNMKNWFWWSIIVSFCTSLTCALNGFNPNAMTEAQLASYNYAANPAVIIALIILCVVEIYIAIVYAYRTSKVFGHGIGYTIGLLFLSNIFLLILGFGKSKYDKKALKK